MKKYKVIFNSSMDINSFQKKYFNNAFNSNVYLLEKNASNNFLSFISEKPISLIDMVSDADVCEISSENYNYNIDFPWCKNEKLFLNFSAIEPAKSSASYSSFINILIPIWSRISSINLN